MQSLATKGLKTQRYYPPYLSALARFGIRDTKRLIYSSGHTKNISERLELRRNAPGLRPFKVAKGVEPLRVQLIDLKHNHCRYTYETDGVITFCGASPASLIAKPYCGPHNKLSYLKG